MATMIECTAAQLADFNTTWVQTGLDPAQYGQAIIIDGQEIVFTAPAS